MTLYFGLITCRTLLTGQVYQCVTQVVPIINMILPCICSLLRKTMQTQRHVYSMYFLRYVVVSLKEWECCCKHTWAHLIYTWFCSLSTLISWALCCAGRSFGILHSVGTFFRQLCDYLCGHCSPRCS